MTAERLIGLAIRRHRTRPHVPTPALTLLRLDSTVPAPMPDPTIPYIGRIVVLDDLLRMRQILNARGYDASVGDLHEGWRRHSVRDHSSGWLPAHLLNDKVLGWALLHWCDLKPRKDRV